MTVDRADGQQPKFVKMSTAVASVRFGDFNEWLEVKLKTRRSYAASDYYLRCRITAGLLH